MKKQKKILERATALKVIEEIISKFTELASTTLLQGCCIDFLGNAPGFTIEYYGSGVDSPNENFEKFLHIYRYDYEEIALEAGYSDEGYLTKIVPSGLPDYTFVAQLIVNFLERGEYPSE